MGSQHKCCMNLLTLDPHCLYRGGQHLPKSGDGAATKAGAAAISVRRCSRHCGLGFSAQQGAAAAAQLIRQPAPVTCYLLRGGGLEKRWWVGEGSGSLTYFAGAWQSTGPAEVYGLPRTRAATPAARPGPRYNLRGPFPQSPSPRIR